MSLTGKPTLKKLKDRKKECNWQASQHHGNQTTGYSYQAEHNVWFLLNEFPIKRGDFLVKMQSLLLFYFFFLTPLTGSDNRIGFWSDLLLIKMYLRYL